MEESDDIIELPYASFLSRTVAFIIDYLLISTLMSFWLAFVLPAEFMAEGPGILEYDEEYVRNLTEAAGPWLYVFLLLWCLYNAAMHAGKWQATLGKRLMGIIVTDTEGERISFGKALIRSFSKLLSIIVFIFILLIAAFTSRRQAIHDMISKTVVLKYKI